MQSRYSSVKFSLLPLLLVVCAGQFEAARNRGRHALFEQWNEEDRHLALL
uniref:Uncharacterized protein n=1 Tax=Arundo donax TaxID=35708 RepID=A0A0A9HHF3_ARUDO